MSLDESLVHAINGFAGQWAWLDELALSLSRSSLLWVPGIVLTGYWLWLSWREALLAAPVLAASIGLLDFVGARIKDLAARPRPCMAFPDIHQIEACGKTFRIPVESRHQHCDGCSLSPCSLSAVRLGELATSRTDRSVACVYRSPLPHGLAGRLDDRRLVRSRRRVAALALLTCSLFNSQSYGQGACPTLIVLLRRTIRSHLRRSRPEKILNVLQRIHLRFFWACGLASGRTSFASSRRQCQTGS